jgi:hypothetical protein
MAGLLPELGAIPAPSSGHSGDAAQASVTQRFSMEPR